MVTRAATYTSDAMANKRVRFRPPGLKPSTKVGQLGPYRGRLGLAWVVAPIVLGVILVVAAYLALR
jgi:hypothetical protein